MLRRIWLPAAIVILVSIAVRVMNSVAALPRRTCTIGPAWLM